MNGADSFTVYILENLKFNSGIKNFFYKSKMDSTLFTINDCTNLLVKLPKKCICRRLRKTHSLHTRRLSMSVILFSSLSQLKVKKKCGKSMSTRRFKKLLKLKLIIFKSQFISNV